MVRVLDYPLAVLAISIVTQGLAAYFGDFLRRRDKTTDAAKRRDFGTILPAALTLLGLIIGFSFSMAVSRYDLRKNYEEAEANAIGTEYLRADLLPPAVGTRVRGLLASYLEQRILFFQVRDRHRLEEINAKTITLQNELWLAVAQFGAAQPTPVSALVLSGMNDVLNSQGYTQAALWNRIPIGAWVLLFLVSIACNILIGFSERHSERVALFVLPTIVAIALFLIADIDSPRGGVIRVIPQNLEALSVMLQSH